MVATTSAGVAWSLGRPDGDALDRQTAVDAIARIVGAVDVPVTADIETGYGDTPDDVAETIRAVLDAGAVGVNLETPERRPSCGRQRNRQNESPPPAKRPHPRASTSTSTRASTHTCAPPANRNRD